MPETKRLRRARRFAERRVTSRGSDALRESYSSSLLESLWLRTPEPDYELAAKSGAPKRPSTKLIAGIVAVFLGLTGSIAVVQLTRGSGGERTTADYLIEQIEQRSQENEDLAASNEQRAARLSEAQTSVLGEDRSSELEALAEKAALTPVTGPGVTLTLTDQDTSALDNDPREAPPEANKVHDEDIQAVINAMFASGAYAVAVNGHRITTTSAVRSAGGAILVNYDPLRPPYEVVAVGPEDLIDRLDQTQAASYLATISKDYGIGYSASTSAEVTIPAAELSQPRYAQPKGEEPADSEETQ